MRKSYFYYAFSVILMIAFFNEVTSNSSGAPSGRTGSPIDVGTCNAAGCHNSFALNSGDGTLSFTHNIPATGYVAGNTYNFNINMTEVGIGRFGFEASVYAPSTNMNAGTLTVLNTNETKLNPGDNYITHTANGISGSDTKDWSFDWVAPNPPVGAIVVHVSGIASNANGNPSGDQVYNMADTIVQEPGVAIEPIRDLFHAKVYPYTGRRVCICGNGKPGARYIKRPHHQPERPAGV